MSARVGKGEPGEFTYRLPGQAPTFYKYIMGIKIYIYNINKYPIYSNREK